jgi:tryptophan 2,3-dioxygenase
MTGFLGYDDTDLARQYSPSSLVPSLDAYLDEYAKLSAQARQHSEPVELRYGDEPDARLDLFGVDGENAPLMVFVHGGYWQELTKDESAFAATDFTSAGIAFAALDYGLAPDHSLDAIVAMVRTAVTWLHANAAELGINPRRIHLSGSSAGAHLIAMACITDEDHHIASATLLSGVYDLEPLRHTYVNDALGLSMADALRNSPIYRLPDRLPPIVIARGGAETDEFIRQHDTMTALLRLRTEVTEVVSPERNHFDLPYDLGDAHTALGAAVVSRIAAPPRVQETRYAGYARMDALLTLQHPQTQAPTEPGFIILSQVKELLFALLHLEFGTARDQLAKDDLDQALWTLRRAGRVQQVLLSCWAALAALSPDEFASFREVLGSASGFQSVSYRKLEFLLGNKNARLVEPHRNTPHYDEVMAQLHEPSLYDEALRYLARRGLDIPAEVLDRDVSQRYQPNEQVELAWRQIYTAPQREHDLFLLAEALTDTADQYARWRYTHLVTVQRMLGDKPGTGGTEGSSWLSRIAEHRFFPELWSMRSTL